MRDLSRTADALKESVPRSQLEEFELVRRAQLGSSAAFDELVVRRGPDLYRYLVARLRNDSDARDALQEALTDAWRGLPGLRQADRFWPWLVAIAARKAAAVARSRGAAAELDVAVSSDDDPGLFEIWDAVGRLPARYRDVLLLRYRLELTEEETAQALRIRVGTVKSRCARGRKALLELLA
jgi:RNA polymerase sigma-70 factor (ECF subfamily)